MNFWGSVMPIQNPHVSTTFEAPHATLNLRTGTFYGIILSGLLLGMFASCLGGWLYLKGDSKPTGRGIWDESASAFVIPICAIIGATFGGLAGVGTAVGLTAYRRARIVGPDRMISLQE